MLFVNVSDCSYEEGEWSDCDPTTGLQTTQQRLHPQSDETQCQKVKYLHSFTVKPFFRAFAKISIRAGLIFALSHCG